MLRDPTGKGPSKRRTRFGVSLRAKMLALIGGGAAFAIVATLVLVLAVRQADSYLARASAAQRHLELLISLSGRISDYGLTVMEAVGLAEARPQTVGSGRDRVNAIFSALDTIVSEQVGLFDTDVARNAAATKSLIIARMRAQFEALHERILAVARSDADRTEKPALARGAMDAFGVGFAPILAQALEDERAGARQARDDMTALRDRATIFAIVWVLSTAAAAIVLYLAAGRSIMTRIAETVRGARAISSGQLNKRLAPSGRDELTLLMVRFNRMADSFSRREKRLLTAQRDLKQTIAARTADLSEANSRLEDIDTNRRRFFSDISHELRTPLTVILGEAEVSLRQTGDDEATPVAKAFRTIHARAENLRRRVDDLLRVARSESGRLDLVFEASDLNALVADALTDVARLAQRFDVTVDVEPASSPLIISADKDWLKQVITGLLINALKYSPDGGTVSVGTTALHDRARLEIRDQGCGVAAEDLPHICDRFYRGRNRPHREEGGYGVGLALVKWVVTEHDGEIVVTSPARSGADVPGSVNPGTSVFVELPLALEQGAPESTE